MSRVHIYLRPLEPWTHLFQYSDRSPWIWSVAMRAPSVSVRVTLDPDNLEIAVLAPRAREAHINKGEVMRARSYVVGKRRRWRGLGEHGYDFLASCSHPDMHCINGVICRTTLVPPTSNITSPTLTIPLSHLFPPSSRFFSASNPRPAIHRRQTLPSSFGLWCNSHLSTVMKYLRVIPRFFTDLRAGRTENGAIKDQGESPKENKFHFDKFSS